MSYTYPQAKYQVIHSTNAPVALRSASVGDALVVSRTWLDSRDASICVRCGVALGRDPYAAGSPIVRVLERGRRFGTEKEFHASGALDADDLLCWSVCAPCGLVLAREGVYVAITDIWHGRASLRTHAAYAERAKLEALDGDVLGAAPKTLDTPPAIATTCGNCGVLERQHARAVRALEENVASMKDRHDRSMHLLDKTSVERNDARQECVRLRDTCGTLTHERDQALKEMAAVAVENSRLRRTVERFERDAKKRR